jgi:oligopeptide/dipeptide ABC transporter ATP-binding protein
MNITERVESMIEIEDVHVNFTVKKKKRTGGARSADCVRAVDGVTLDIRAGEILAVVGESGCGKTTLGKAVLNIVKPASGTIRYRGRDLSAVSKKEFQSLRQKLQLIFQDPYEALDPRQSVYKTLLEPLSIHRKDLLAEEKQKLIYFYLEAVGLYPAASVAERFPHHLSGGQRQRLSIASTMILEPEFVVADEPVSMLDVSVRAEILKLMLDLRQNKDLTYMFITHDLSLAWVIADRIAVFYLGKMMELGPAHEVVHHCRHPYSKALVSVIPSMGEQRGERYVLLGETPSPTQIPEGCRFHARCWLYHKRGAPEICRNKVPEPIAVGDGHVAACHFAEEELL